MDKDSRVELELYKNITPFIFFKMETLFLVFSWMNKFRYEEFKLVYVLNELEKGYLFVLIPHFSVMSLIIATTIWSNVLCYITIAGSTFLYSTGAIQLLCITDAEMGKEMSLCTSLNLGKPSYLSTERGPLLGRGRYDFK